MKHFIVLLAVLPILLMFLLQFSLDQINNHRIGRFQEYVYAAKEEAKQKGCFSEEIKKELIKNISNSFDINEEDILLELDETPRYRTDIFDERELIHYKISVPIEKIMAGNVFLGISDEDNRGMYTVESWTASERIRN
ncbi:MAG: hypothetical protein ACOX5F_05875 [Anaerovoracaceae bacterium]|jgi:hypothetical protein